MLVFKVTILLALMALSKLVAVLRGGVSFGVYLLETLEYFFVRHCELVETNVT